MNSARPVIPLDRVLARAMERLGVTNARQLADAIGMTDIDRERRVRRWLTLENEPNYRYTLMLLEAAGLLCSDLPRHLHRRLDAHEQRHRRLAG